MDDGIIPRGEWGNWPPGEVYTTPETANGVIIVDGVIGDYFSTKYGALREAVRVEVRDGKVTAIMGGEIARELQDYLSQYPCGLRVGELGIGGNPKITEPIGNMLHDEKMPGAHIALGDPLGNRTGADWKCNVHVDLLPLKTTVKVDDKIIIKRVK